MSLELMKRFIPLASFIILILCLIAAFILFNATGFSIKDDNTLRTAIGFYFLAKGIFCSLLLYLTSEK